MGQNFKDLGQNFKDLVNTKKPDRIWIRKIQETRTFYQLYEASSGKAMYVEKDGEEVGRTEVPNSLKVEVLEQFRNVNDLEYALYTQGAFDFGE